MRIGLTSSLVRKQRLADQANITTIPARFYTTAEA
jgi:hypothetical protein